MMAAHARYPLLSDLGGERRTKPVPPEPDRLIADADPALRQEDDVARRQCAVAHPPGRVSRPRQHLMQISGLKRATRRARPAAAAAMTALTSL